MCMCKVGVACMCMCDVLIYASESWPVWVCITQGLRVGGLCFGVYGIMNESCHV